ncbi:MAG: lactonase family protein [Victivallales bacterium]|jgi:6-phosphogluconolactonase|nr:lactonase family protein [Victivallales bacterium]
MTPQFYIAAMSDTPEGGIYRYEMRENAAPKQVGFTPMANVNYLAFSPDRKFLYSTCTVDGQDGVAAFAIGEDGELTFIGSMASGGKSACYVVTDPSGQFLYCANYRTGNLTEFRLEEGKIAMATQTVYHKGKGPHEVRQEGPHTHFSDLTPDGKFMVVIDLGIDSVFTYPIDPETGIDAKNPNVLKVSPGDGPRHLIFDDTGKIAYLANELGNSVISLAYNDGVFTVIEKVSTLPRYWEGATKVAAIRLSEDDRFLFVSNRGFDSIAVYELDGKGGMKLFDMVLSGGSSPRDINFLPGGKWFGAANEFSDKVVFFDYDGKGKLTPNGFELKLPRPLNIHW